MKPISKKVCSTLAIAAALFVAAQEANAKLEFESRDIHTTATAYDKEVRVLYHFTNKGQKPIKITWIKSSCGCLTPKVNNELVAPGQQGEIEVVFKLERRQGLQKRSVTVNTDDPEEARIGLNLSAQLPEVVKPSEKQIVFADGEMNTRKFTVTTDASIPVQELTATTRHPALDVKIQPAGANSYTVEVTPRTPAGRIAGKVDLEAKLGDGLSKGMAVSVVRR